MTPRIAAIIQARMGSSRLPGKVLMDIAGEPMLRRVVDRTQLATTADEVIVATTTEVLDDGIATYCAGAGIETFRGSQFDVLDRYFLAAKATRADVVVRITADCPLIDAGIIDATVRTLRSGAPDAETFDTPGGTAFDMVANRLPPPWQRTYPIGLDTEACTFAALERAWSASNNPVDREHVMPYLYRGVQLRPHMAGLEVGTSGGGFRIAVLQHNQDLGAMRWTVDTVADLEFVRKVYAAFPGRSDFNWLEVVDLLRARPELATINADVPHKTLLDVDERSRGAITE